MESNLNDVNINEINGYNEEDLASLLKEIEQEELGQIDNNNIIHATGLTVPFSKLIRPANILVLDVETNEDKFILIFGYYIFGESIIHQLIFHEPTDPKQITRTQLFKKLIAHSNYKVAVYNASFESKLFNIPRERIIETMSIPFVKKDDLISIKTIDQAAPKTVGSVIDSAKMCEITFRNISCIMKTAILVLGFESFARFNVKHLFIHQLKNYLRGKIYE